MKTKALTTWDHRASKKWIRCRSGVVSRLLLLVGLLFIITKKELKETFSTAKFLESNLHKHKYFNKVLCRWSFIFLMDIMDATLCMVKRAQVKLIQWEYWTRSIEKARASYHPLLISYSDTLRSNLDRQIKVLFLSGKFTSHSFKYIRSRFKTCLTLQIRTFK